MYCIDCKSEKLLCHVQANVVVPLSQRGGTINLKGFVVKQTDVKAWWDKENGLEANPDRMIRGPIICADCCAEHVYLKGLQPSLRKITYAEALALGYDHFAATSEAGSDEAEE